MPKFIDISGQRFGRLLAVQRAPNIGKLAAYECVCDCGTVVIKPSMRLKTGGARSCGCLRKETAATHARQLNLTHGLTSKTNTPRWYQIWSGVMKRCYNKNSNGFRRYGARGITVAERWHDPRNFLADMGEPPPEHSIDRINNNGPYSPDNCRWATNEVQSNNRGCVVRLTFDGVTDTLSGWSKRTGISRSALHLRYYQGWSTERLLTQPQRKAPKAPI